MKRADDTSEEGSGSIMTAKSRSKSLSRQGGKIRSRKGSEANLLPEEKKSVTSAVASQSAAPTSKSDNLLLY
jgi:hypothetical protein